MVDYSEFDALHDASNTHPYIDDGDMEVQFTSPSLMDLPLNDDVLELPPRKRICFDSSEGMKKLNNIATSCILIVSYLNLL